MRLNPKAPIRIGQVILLRLQQFWYSPFRLGRLAPKLPKLYRSFLSRGITMKYMFAWLLGVPGLLILAWFLFNHR